MNDASVKPSHRRRARVLALQALYQWRLAETPVADIEAQFRADNDMAKVDEAYFSELLRQCMTEQAELDALYAPFLDRPLDDLDPIEQAILRLATYELKARIDVPYRVVINEAIDLTKKFGGADGHKFVNGVLDKLAPRLRAAEPRPR